ncbi:MAG: hypothetical protein AAGA47_02190 [Pseudomonadota bacterium]
MSDPVINVEIEDVLSSIRKLVSQDSAAKEASDDAQENALILTEDHRIDEKPETPIVAKPDMADMRRRAASTVRTELERAIEELEATMGLTGALEETTQKASEPSDVNRADSELDEEATSNARPVADPTPTEPVAENVREEAEAPSEDAAEEAVLSDEAGFEASQEKDDAPLGSQPAPEDEIDWDAPVGKAMEGAPPEPEVATEEATEERSVLEAIKIVSDASGYSEQSYDESYEGDVLKGAELEFEDSAAEESEFEEPEGPFEERSVDPWPEVEEAEVTAPSELSIDEEMLRDLVADIVRSELQGELGERITRNVRKLVRREINRALAGQDLI